MCGEDEYIGGIRVRIEANQGTSDDTAMNGLQIECINGF